MRWSWFFFAGMVVNYTLAFMFFALGNDAQFTACVAVAVACFALGRQEADYECDDEDEA